MNKQQILRRLCALITEVNNRVYKWQIASDCFCGENKHNLPFHFEETALLFVEAAVRERIKEGKENQC